METLLEGIMGMGAEPGRIVMMLIGCVLMYLGIKKGYEPTLLVPMGLGTLLVNFPNTGVLMTGGEAGPFQVLFDAGIATELFPLLLFVGIGAMIDFGPLLQNPFLLLFGAAAQFGIFFTVVVAVLLGFDITDAGSIGIIAAADGPTSIFVPTRWGPSTSAPSWWRPTPTWRSCPSSSRPLSAPSPPRRSAAYAWRTVRARSPRRQRSCSPS